MMLQDQEGKVIRIDVLDGPGCGVVIYVNDKSIVLP